MAELWTSANGFTPYGAAKDFFYDRSQEIMLAGPAETGKTISALYKLHILCCLWPNVHAAMIRKTQKSVYASVVKTYQEKVLGEGTPVTHYGGKKPEWFDYPNGSRIIVAGMDNPNKVLSTEFDFIYVNQAEELSLTDWEPLTTRSTGRAGHTPYPQLFGDCNPGPRSHWILGREKEKSLRRLNSKHVDNPTLFDPVTGEITQQGKLSMAVLNKLTGIRRDRLRDGLWVSSEGMIYSDFDRDTHVLSGKQLVKIGIFSDDRKPTLGKEKVKRVLASVDWGFTNPGVIQVWAVDNDDRLYLVHETYMTGQVIEWWVKQAVELNERFGIERFTCDPAEPAYIAAFKKAGLKAEKAKNPIRPGINAVQERLIIQDDGSPRIYFYADAVTNPDDRLEEERQPVGTVDEIDGYVWADKRTKEEPEPGIDHGMDCMRYMCMLLESGSQVRISSRRREI